MKKTSLVSFAVMAALSTSAFAGTIHGKVSGVNGESVVYVEAVAGKTFPAPAQHVTIDQKGLDVRAAHSVLRKARRSNFSTATALRTTSSGPPSAGTKSSGHNLGTWPKGQTAILQIRRPRRCLVALQCSSGDVRLRDRLAHSLLRGDDKSGEFKIENVPDGAYTVTAWHEGAKSKSNPVKVAGDTAADFTLTK